MARFEAGGEPQSTVIGPNPGSTPRAAGEIAPEAFEVGKIEIEEACQERIHD